MKPEGQQQARAGAMAAVEPGVSPVRVMRAERQEAKEKARAWRLYRKQEKERNQKREKMYPSKLCYFSN